MERDVDIDGGRSRRPSRWPSLDLVRAELDRQSDMLQRRVESIEAKAGLVVGFALVLVGLGGDRTDLGSLAGEATATLAAIVAAVAFWPRQGDSIGASNLRDLARTADPHRVSTLLLDVRLGMYNDDEKRLGVKQTLVRWGTGLLATAVCIALGSAVVADLRGD